MQNLNVRRVSRLALISLLLTASSNSVPSISSQAMEITDETTHEQVYSSKDGAEKVAGELEKELFTEQAEESPSGGADMTQEATIESPTDSMQAAIDPELELIEGQDGQDHGDTPMVSVVDTNQEKEGDFVEESDTPDGRHIRKEVHQGPGFKSVRITQSSGGGSGPRIGGPGPSIMQAMMEDMMQQMAGGARRPPAGGQMIMSGPGGGRVIIRQAIPVEPDDEDDDQEADGIPPEIAELLRMTDAMHRRAAGGVGGFGLGGPRQLRGGHKEEKDDTPRHEESHDAIMAKMNKLSEEIGERHDQDKLTRLKEKKSQRFTQVLAALGAILLLMLVSFVIQCQTKKGRDSEVEDEEPSKSSVGGNRRVGKAD